MCNANITYYICGATACIAIGPANGSLYMARLRATGADWGLDIRIIF